MKTWLLLLSIVLINFSCGTLKDSWDNLNLFPVSQDVELGKQVSEEIAANQKDFPILNEQENQVLYQYVRKIVTKILNEGSVEYAKDFVWRITLINDMKTLNAFATPGGYIYVYTGLIHFLDSEDQLAGVLGHEIAHAAKRHSTKQLSKMLGLQVLADAALGNKETVKQVATALIGLTFSRASETQADSMSVIYLCPTEYYAAGAAGFFKKIQTESTPPEWLSTHPNPGNRIQSIESKYKSSGCTGNQTYVDQYTKIKLLIESIPTLPGKSAKTTDKMNKPIPTNSGSGNQQNKKIEKPR
jgi:predicted Zn-dependent protease